MPATATPAYRRRPTPTLEMEGPPATMGGGYIITGRAAHDRVGRLFHKLLNETDKERLEDIASASHDGASALLSSHSSSSLPLEWIDLSPYAKNGTDDTRTSVSISNINYCNENSEENRAVSFLWENAPRHETKSIRDRVSCYSHLPHGIILDDKWALARLLGGENTKRNAICDDTSDDAMGNPNLVTLESHCFRGAGFASFVQRVGLLRDGNNGSDCQEDEEGDNGKKERQYEDLLPRTSIMATTERLSRPPPPPKNLWVIKDAMSNGAGGIWIIDESNVRDFLDNDDTQESTTTVSNNQNNTSVLHPTHRYIAQRYAWPPTLYSGRKCHVRVYALVTSEGRAYVHRSAFLHVANELFVGDTLDEGGEESGKTDKRKKFEPSVHITNCCANSHDLHKFAGEICVDLETMPNDTPTSPVDNEEDKPLPLGEYLPSISASIAALAQSFAPFIRGGEANGGFEYLGLDFVLSSVEDEGTQRPVAYLLEVNAPPSQDTATGLDHAEMLHDEVISDLLRMWVLPNVGVGSKEARDCGGWRCVYTPPVKEEEVSSSDNLIVPSKAAVLNRIRWALFERRAISEYELMSNNDAQRQVELKIQGESNDKTDPCESRMDTSFDSDAFVSYVRSQFPYFSETESIFFESGGGSQVPRLVSNAIMTSLNNRDRSVVGAATQKEARSALSSLLIDTTTIDEDKQQHRDDAGNHMSILGANATSLLDLLARKIHLSGIIAGGDEIVVASENHLANVTPWIELARLVGAKVKWWTVTDSSKRNKTHDHGHQATESYNLSDLITERTKIVAVSHVSNILGMERDIHSICSLVHRITKNRGHVIVDGVAAAPHLLSSKLDTMSGPDWYVASLHKLFGPHLGCLIGKRRSAERLVENQGDDVACNKADPLSTESLAKSWELGTINYEACSGAIALKSYFEEMGRKAVENSVFGRDRSSLKTSKSGSDFGGEELSVDSVHRSPFNLDIARTCIEQVENSLLDHLLSYLQSCAPLVRIVQDVGEMKVTNESLSNLGDKKKKLRRIPILCFTHANIPSRTIVEHCRTHGVICRACKFLSTKRLWDELGIEDDGVVRFSLAHYNTPKEIDEAIRILRLLDGWQEIESVGELLASN